MEVGKLILNVGDQDEGPHDAQREALRLHALVGRLGRRPVAHHRASIPRRSSAPIETSGDGAVNVYSRVQMYLFKARQRAEAEYRETLAAAGLDQAAAERQLARTGKARTLHYPEHNGITAGTGATQLLEI